MSIVHTMAADRSCDSGGQQVSLVKRTYTRPDHIVALVMSLAEWACLLCVAPRSVPNTRVRIRRTDTEGLSCHEKCADKADGRRGGRRFRLRRLRIRRLRCPPVPCPATWDDVVAAAKGEGSVLLYSSQKPANLDALKVAFEQEYPEISLEYVRGTDADINPKVEVENQTKRGTADVHMLTDAAWIETAAESGTYSTDLVGPAFDTPEYEPQTSIISDKFFLTSAAVFSLGWNTTALPGGLQKPEDLLDPALKGKIGIVNPSGIASYVDFYRFFEKNFGADYLQKLAELKPRIYPSALGVAQALTSGEIVATPMVQPLVREKESVRTGRLGICPRRRGEHPGSRTPCPRRRTRMRLRCWRTSWSPPPARRRCRSAMRAPFPHRRQRRAGPGHRTAQPVRSDARIAHRIPGRLGKAIHPVGAFLRDLIRDCSP